MYPDPFSPQPVTLHLDGELRFTLGSYSIKLFRIRDGKLTLLNGFGTFHPSLYEAAESYARRGDGDGDRYLLLNVDTGKVLSNFKLQAPVAEKEVVEL